MVGKMMKHFAEEHGDNTELLPGIPNHVTVQLICTKLPWRSFHVLSSVSRVWLGAIRSGEISDARVRSDTVETLAFVECSISEDPEDKYACKYALALYSLRDKAIYRLPTFPPFEHLRYQFYRGYMTASGGKIYILGAIDREVWVLDVVGQKKWQECASMLTPRMKFECAVFEGKIYVFGGYNEHRQPIDFSEVYDPKVDAWTKISPMKSGRIVHKALAVRHEILVGKGRVYDPGHSGFHGEKDWRPVERFRDSMEAYNPAKDSWRTIPPGDFGKDEFEILDLSLCTAHGRLHSLSISEIVLIDLDKKSVKGLHTYSIETRSKISHPRRFCPDQVLATKDGLLSIGQFATSQSPGNIAFTETRLYQSGITELGMGKEKIVLEEVECSPLVSFFGFAFLRPIQL